MKQLCLILFLTLPGFLWGQFEKREGAETGKPCRYDHVPRPSVLVTPERLTFVRNDILQKKSERRDFYDKYKRKLFFLLI